MTAEWVTAAASVFTCLVIAATAVAALAQLRHMRGANQILALTECRETLESQEFREAQQFVSIVGLFVRKGIIEKSIACDSWSFVILRNWQALAPVVEVVRRSKTLRSESPRLPRTRPSDA
jgi:hypothetical protein